MANEFRVKNGLIVSGNATVSGIVLDGNTITGVDDSGEFTDDDAHIMTSAGINDKFGVIAGSSSIVTVGTIGTGTWQGTAIASAYLDADTAHLSGTQTFSGAKTFSSTVSVAGEIQHSGDTNNSIAFGTDTQTYETGGSTRLDISDSGVRLGGANSRVTTILDENDMSSDSDTALATQQSIKKYVDDSVGSAGGGDITAVTAGVGLSGGGTTGGVTLTLDMSELTDMTADVTDNADEFIILDGGADRRKMMNEIDVGGFRDVITGPFHFETDQENVALGEGALDSLTQYVSGLVLNGGNHNTAIGENAGTAVSTGDSNTLLGHDAGETITTGSSNTVVGADAEPSAVNASNQIVIGQGAVGLADNSVVLGNTSITAWLPPDDAGVDLGSSSYQFKDGYFHGTLESDAITIGGTAIAAAGTTSITTLGTIGTGTWQGTAIASAYLDADTAHLSGTQTFSGNKTFSGSITLGGHAVNDIDVAGEFVDSDEHLMTSAAINDRIAAAGGGASVLGDLTDVTMDITNFVDGILIQPNSDGSAPTTGTLSSATENIGIGKNVFQDLTSGDYNVVVGPDAGMNLTSGGYNVLVGRETGQYLTTSSSVVAIGDNAGRFNSGATNTFIGVNAGKRGTEGATSNNTFVGNSVGLNNTGGNNTVMGHQALAYGQGGANNTIMGYLAGQDFTSDYNVAIGSSAALNVTSGTRVIAIGANSMDAATTESDNIAIGYDALGGAVAGGEKNIAIGNYSLDALTSADHNIAIGYNAGGLIQDGGSNVVIGSEAAGNGDIGANNVLVGMQAGYGSTDATQSVAVGNDAGKFGLKAATGSIAMGQNALKGHSSNTTGANYNTALGHYSMEDVTTGDDNTAVGSYALTNITTATGNVAIGHDAGKSITTGGHNIAIGHQALDAVSTNGQNVAIGMSALGLCTSGNNVAVGADAGRVVTSGGQNVFVGYATGYYATSSANTLVGYGAGDNVTTGGNNTLLGVTAGGAINSGTDNIMLGRNAGDNITSGDNNVIIGAIDADSATADDQLIIASGDGGVTWIKGASTGVVDFPNGLTSGGSAIGGGGISNVVEDTSPQLGGDLDTNGHDIIIDDGKGIYADAISNGRELLLFQHTADGSGGQQANSYLQVWNGIADHADGTLFGNDVISTDTTGTGRMTGPGLEATGSTTDVGMSFKTKGLGQFTFFSDETSSSAAPVVSLVRYVDDGDVADDDILGLIKFMGGQTGMASPFLHDLRDYAKIECNLVDVSSGTADGNLMLSAMCANTHTDFLEIGTNKTNDTSAGVRAFTGSMVTYSGTGTTALSRDTHAGAYVRATGAGTFTLWDSPKTGDQVVVISDHAGTTTIDGHSSDTINGSANTTITTQYNAKTFIATSSSTWIALG
tara:strand:+ start:18495 stop:22637 length:4143 start_codon:yes stop_codon:yes gene_type:complete